MELLKDLRAAIENCRACEQDATADLMERAVAEIENQRMNTIAFGAPWASEYARQMGFPRGHIHRVHYAILSAAGARMDCFTKHDDQIAAPEPHQ